MKKEITQEEACIVCDKPIIEEDEIMTIAGSVCCERCLEILTGTFDPEYIH